MPTDTRLRSLASHAELLELTQGDPFVRWGIPDPLPGVVLATDGAVAVERFGRRGRGLWVFPHSGGGTEAIRALLGGLGGPMAELQTAAISIPQEYAAQLAEAFPLGTGGEWDWMWTTRTPPRGIPGESDLIVLDDTDDAAEIAALSTAHSPSGEGGPGTGRTRLWLGLRSTGTGADRRLAASGELVAVGAMQSLESGVPHLAGIVTHGSHRGRGLARAITAGLTRSALTSHGVCTLGMYSDNPSARAVYTGLGYRTAHAWHSRRILTGSEQETLSQ
ncbi:hypothetical protein FNH13_11735 [Ornithinimicrobium ciconiae]|uniref:GCN5-related N-acetyltransferase Rv2170-like domain-containing protein n=1 Tax=Ornithinimicrobium ciconiae TaxID=2594265 RepID=A0A516GBK6_9MICO|nr:GNAT family N-acetyltransferase [Ornithinimicrobium ciconiae]QDO88914.1 hypothetical protein FNH13_11735 [Ornithinimicrobium ciconiae]